MFKFKKKIKSRLKKIYQEKFRERLLHDMLRLTNEQKNPNFNSLWAIIKDLDAMRLNIKNFGYELSRKFEPLLNQIDIVNEPRCHNLVSKPTTQADIESPWFMYWCKEICAAPIYHRKIWEFAFTLQALYEHGILKSGKKGIGFGCGREPLASYFAKKNMKVTITDLAPAEAEGMGWRETGQYVAKKFDAFYPDIVSEEMFDANVKHQFVDMNNIPKDIVNYDFCWSICALEHIGSIKKGLEFIKNSLKTLKKGGVAIHTTEYNYISNTETIDNWSTVLFRKKDFQELEQNLRSDGHTILGIDFDVGNQPLDLFIDVPPYDYSLPSPKTRNNHTRHLKLSVDGFPSTCIGIIVIKGGNE